MHLFGISATFYMSPKTCQLYYLIFLHTLNLNPTESPDADTRSYHDGFPCDNSLCHQQPVNVVQVVTAGVGSGLWPQTLLYNTKTHTHTRAPRCSHAHALVNSSRDKRKKKKKKVQRVNGWRSAADRQTAAAILSIINGAAGVKHSERDLRVGAPGGSFPPLRQHWHRGRIWRYGWKKPPCSTNTHTHTHHLEVAFEQQDRWGPMIPK